MWGEIWRLIPRLRRTKKDVFCAPLAPYAASCRPLYGQATDSPRFVTRSFDNAYVSRRSYIKSIIHYDGGLHVIHATCRHVWLI